MDLTAGTAKMLGDDFVMKEGGGWMRGGGNQSTFIVFLQAVNHSQM